jgi:choline dehydrogenase
LSLSGWSEEAVNREAGAPGPADADPDVLVVGGGTAGAVVAGRLVEAGLRVQVLEAGPDYGTLSGGRWPDELLDARTLPVLHDWGYVGPGAMRPVLRFERARVIGGCSAHNGCAQSVGWRGDYDRWASLGCPGWSGAELESFFARAAARMRIRRFSSREIQPFQRAFMDAAVRAGIPETNDLDDLDGGVGCGAEPMNVVDGIRWNAAFAYLDPVRGQDGLNVVGDALVDRVLLQGNRATGVRAIIAGEMRDVPADMVVLAAGAYGSPEILLRSGIGPADDLRAAGIDVAVDLPGVGENLHDQPAAELRFAGTRQLRTDLEAFSAERWLPEEQAIAKIASTRPDGPYDVHVYPWVEPDTETPNGWRCVIPVGLLAPRSRGRLRLRSGDPSQLAEIDHGYLAEPTDVEALVAALEWAIDLARSQPIARYLGDPIDPLPEADDPRGVAAWIRSSHTHYWHPAGSCRMGPSDDPRSVLDARGRVYGVDRLRVADASIFPDIPRATPAFPTVVVGERIADMIVLDET